MALKRGKHRDGGPRLAHRIVSNATLARGTDNVGLQSLILGFTTSIRTLHVRA